MAGNNTNPLKRQEPSALIRERILARRWGKSIRTLQRWRANDYGPAYLVIGGSVLYRLSDVLDFETRMRRSGGDGQ